MRVLVVGGGGREHALAWAIKRSPRCTALFAAPGNAGIATIATCHPIESGDFDGVLRLCQTESIDLAVIGPEAPLVGGLTDHLEEAGIRVFGPSKAAAILEGSKHATKLICDRYGIPTAGYAHVRSIEAAQAEIARHGAPIVIKADGLAAGKGVVVAMTEAEALAAVDMMMAERYFGDAGAELVIEEMLVGEEVSFFALTDGKTAVPLASAQDHKRVGDGDTGPNTGGMGAYSPAPSVNAAMERRIMAEIVEPALAGLAAEGRPFRGVLFAGLMLTAYGPKLIEFNVRFGDPECEVLLRRLRSDVLEALLATVEQRLHQVQLDWDERTALGVVMAASGYPGKPVTGTVINGLEAAATAAPEIEIFHAATRVEADNFVAAGGRVLVVTSLGDDAAAAQARAYAAIDRIDWPEGFCRRDIGWRAIKS